MKLHFPVPVRHEGLFRQRAELVEELRKESAGQANWIFRDKLPDSTEIFKIFELVKRNPFSKEYLGNLLTGEDTWRWTAPLSDLHNIMQGMEQMTEGGEDMYFFTNTAGHHADNQHYELFCPINQLFFLVEWLNLNYNFPQITWIDCDAHFGNGDKKLWDGYREKMKTESNNVRGISFHNDAGDMDEAGYRGVVYNRDIEAEALIELMNKRTEIPTGTKFTLLFFGTDIFHDDYGSNSRLESGITQSIWEVFEGKSRQAGSNLITVQAGGTRKENMKKLIQAVSP